MESIRQLGSDPQMVQISVAPFTSTEAFQFIPAEDLYQLEWVNRHQN